MLKYSFLTNLHRKGSKWEQQAKKKWDLRLSSRFSRAPATLDIHVLIGWILAAFRHLDTGNGAEKSKQEKQRSTIWKHGTSKVHSRLTNCNSSTSRDLCAKGHVRRWKKLKVLVLSLTFFEQVIGRQCFTKLSDVLDKSMLLIYNKIISSRMIYQFCLTFLTWTFRSRLLSMWLHRLLF